MVPVPPGYIGTHSSRLRALRRIHPKWALATRLRQRAK
ncbi:hypothetical protein PTE30175_04771 [Pandoraea terrae]|uniref:Uncharacterized protein n=1 Tax=Pandoraea terrae TaxID=1537710 RepID=A0A5E4Z0G8_9BURK|nr:hypothetical protein PTE30175_04771 [Pandoraea terrae]